MGFSVYFQLLSTGWQASASECQGTLHKWTGGIICLLQKRVSFRELQDRYIEQPTNSVKDYALDMATKSDTNFGTTVLQSLFDKYSWNSSLQLFREDTASQSWQWDPSWYIREEERTINYHTVTVTLWDVVICVVSMICPHISESSTALALN